MKILGFVPPAGLALVLVMMLVGGGAIVWTGIGWIRDFRSDALRDKCNHLEFAVRRYGQAHLAVDTSSEHTDAEETWRYNMMQTYPSSQAKLSELYDLGYLTPSIKLEDFQSEGSAVFYTVNTDQTKYRIEVMLPNGKKYVTPGSSSF